MSSKVHDRPTHILPGRGDSAERNAPEIVDDAPSSRTLARTSRLRRAGLVDGRYELEGMMSQGGMGSVYRARHRELGRAFAMKLVMEGFRDDPERRQLFLSEAQLASSLQHPNIIQVTDFGIDEDHGFFLVMELLEGESLRERLQREPPSLRLSCDVFDKLLGAVRYIHGRGIIHCDLKPENVYLAKVPGLDRRITTVKLLDFGFSWRRGALPESEARGTVPYTAPERYHGHPPTAATDVYSLGMVMYELLCGRLPFTGSIVDVVRQQTEVPPPLPSVFTREPIDPWLEAMVMRALDLDPAKRQQTVEELQVELRAAMDALGIRTRREHDAPDEGQAAAAAAQLAAVVDSPVPLAVCDLKGGFRFANRAFLAGAGGDAPAAFEQLKLVQQQPELAAAFKETIGSGAVVRRLVLTVGGATALLTLSPLVRAGAIESVHITWTLTA